MPRNNELRVFISSTLIREARGRDLQEEHEHLVKKIFPDMIRTIVRDRALPRAGHHLHRGYRHLQPHFSLL
jgi:hypothetical protein